MKAEESVSGKRSAIANSDNSAEASVQMFIICAHVSALMQDLISLSERSKSLVNK